MKGLLFTYLMCYGGVVIALFNPFYGLLIFFMFGILKPEILWHWSVPIGNYSLIVGLATAVGWLFQGMGNWNLRRAWPAIACLTGYLAWATVCAVQAPIQPIAQRFIMDCAKIVIPVVLGATLINSIEDLRKLAWVFTATYGYLAFEFNLNYYNGFYFGREVEHGMDNNSVCIGLVTACGLAFFLAVNSTRWWQKLVAFTGMGLMTHAILFSNSRGGMTALIFTGAMAFLLIPKQPKHFVWFIIAFAIALRLAGPPVQQRFMTIFAKEEERDASAQSRVLLWRAMWQATMDHPVFGLGPDHWEFNAQFYGRPRMEGHSLWLQTACEIGIPGVLFLAGYYACCLIGLAPLAWGSWRIREPWMSHLARGVIASLVGFAVSAQFVTLEGLEIPYYVALLGAGVLKLSTDPRYVVPNEYARVMQAQPLWRQPYPA